MGKYIVTFALLSTFTQLIGIVTKRVKAPRAPWIIWFLIGVLCFVVNYGFNGWDMTSKLLASYSFGNLFIVGYILIKNPSGWTKRETKILLLTVAIILCWLPFKIVAERQALLWATIFSQLLLHSAHFIGVWNHWLKVWNDPFTEAWESWIFRYVSALLTFISLMQTSTLTSSDLCTKLIPPVYAIITVTILLGLIVIRRRKLSGQYK